MVFKQCCSGVVIDIFAILCNISESKKSADVDINSSNSKLSETLSGTSETIATTLNSNSDKMEATGNDTTVAKEGHHGQESDSSTVTKTGGSRTVPSVSDPGRY